jgi:hypothetical protein
MSALSIEVPFPVFQDRDGQPLENGYIWLGVANLNPQVNPIIAYFDVALTIPAAQPLRTINGYISNAGTPAQVYVDAVNFSILVQDSKGSMVYNFADGTGISPDACGVTYDPPFTGAVAYPVCEKLDQVMSVKDFGAVGDGVADDTAAIQLALNAGQNGAVYFPTGTYKVSSPLTVKPSTHVFGSGFDAIIKTNSATANIFNVSGQYVYISDIAFNSSVPRTGGYYVDILSGSSRFRIEQFWMYNAHSGICVRNTSATVTIARGEILNNVAVTGIGIKLEGGLDVSIRDILMDQAAQIYAGIYITNAGDVTIEDCQLITCGQALYIEADNTVISSVWANNTFFDNSTRGLYVLANNGGTVARCLFDQCWFSSSATQGVLLNTETGGLVDGIDFNGCHVFLNTTNGFQIENNSKNIQIHGCAIAANALNGVAIAANVNFISVQDCHIGAGYGLAANFNGILVSAGTSDYLRICNNDLNNNNNEGMIFAATGFNSVVSGNLNYSGWISYTPTVTSTAGTITTLGTVVAKYQKENKTVNISLDIPITTNGTGSGVIRVSFPFTAASAAAFAGRENAITGQALSASIGAATTLITVSTYTGAYPGADGYRLFVSGTVHVV